MALTAEKMSLSPNPSRNSISSASTVTSASQQLPPYDTTFTPTTTLHIHSRGLRLIRFPLPSSELTIPIYSENGDLKYASHRAKKCSGNATLHRIVSSSSTTTTTETWTEGETTLHGIPLASTEYFFGPYRDPIIKILDTTSTSSTINLTSTAPPPPPYTPTLEEKENSLSPTKTLSSPLATETFKFKSSSCPSRTCTFTHNGQTYEWSHERTILPSTGEKAKILALNLLVPKEEGKGKKAEKIRVAQLVRSQSTRTAGTRPSTAGNGGVLEMGALVRNGVDGGITGDEKQSKLVGIDEVVVVATCVSMLKKEVDRRRLLQTVVIMGAAGS